MVHKLWVTSLGTWWSGGSGAHKGCGFQCVLSAVGTFCLVSTRHGGLDLSDSLASGMGTRRAPAKS